MAEDHITQKEDLSEMDATLSGNVSLALEEGRIMIILADRKLDLISFIQSQLG